MSDFVSSPLKEGIGQIPADLIQELPLGQELGTQTSPEIGTVIYNAGDNIVGTPDYTALIEKTERERQNRLSTVRGLLKELLSEKSTQYSKSLNEAYYRGQAKQLGFWIPLDPGRINGQAYPVPYKPNRADYPSEEKYEQAQSNFADALSSQEKHSLSGVPFN